VVTRLLEAQVRRLGRESVWGCGRILREGAVAGAEHLVANLELGHLPADRLDGPGDIHAANTDLGSSESEADDAEQVRQAGHDVPVTDVDPSRVNADEHVVIANLGPINLLEP
jgi:hypothetical protein